MAQPQPKLAAWYRQAWLHFGNGWGIIDASNRSLGDGDLQALAAALSTDSCNCGPQRSWAKLGQGPDGHDLRGA